VEEVVMNRIRRFAAVMAGLVGTQLAFAAGTPHAWATQAPPDPGPAGNLPTPVIHTVVAGGMPGWQIALIAAVAALVAAVLGGARRQGTGRAAARGRS
jgi:hypothetical protein